MDSRKKIPLCRHIQHMDRSTIKRETKKDERTQTMVYKDNIQSRKRTTPPIYTIIGLILMTITLTGCMETVTVIQENYTYENITQANGQIIINAPINLTGAATAWDDLTFPVNNLKVNPATSKPDENTDTIQYLFDDTAIETVRGTGQTSHSQKMNTSLFCHVHWIQHAVGNVTWELNYTIYPPNTTNTSHT